MIANLANRWKATMAMAGVFVMTIGCYNRIAIKKEEATKLKQAYSTSGMAAPVYGATGTTYATVVEKSVIRVEREDGRIYEVTGRADLVVIDEDGNERLYKHPVHVTIDGNEFLVQSKNSGGTTYEMDSIRTVKVREGAYWKTLGLTTLIAVPVTLIILGATGTFSRR